MSALVDLSLRVHRDASGVLAALHRVQLDLGWTHAACRGRALHLVQITTAGRTP